MRAHLFALKYPGARILFVRKAFADLMRTAVATVGMNYATDLYYNKLLPTETAKEKIFFDEAFEGRHIDR